MKVSYKCNLILAVIWILTSLLWFLWIENTAVGIVWLLGGIVELVISLVMRYKETHKRVERKDGRQ